MAWSDLRRRCGSALPASGQSASCGRPHLAHTCARHRHADTAQTLWSCSAAPPMAGASLTQQLHAALRRCHAPTPALVRAACRANP
eukprot:5035581-Pleurochrysis_carterae.AAC.1